MNGKQTPPAGLITTSNRPAARPAKRELPPWIGAMLGVLFLGTLGYLQRDRFLTGQNDFVQLYAGSRLSGTPRLYDPEASKEVHRQVLGVWLESVYYSRPPFYALFLRPLGKLPYKAAYWTFESLSLLALIAFLGIWTPRCRELPLFVSLCLPLLANILTGQDLAFVLLAAALAIGAMRRNWDYAAGLLLSLCAIKIHLFALVPVVLLIHRRWRVLQGGAAGGLVLLSVSFISDGGDWPKRYLALISNPELHPGAEHMPTLRGLVYAFTGAEAPGAVAALSLVVLLAVIHIGRRGNLEFGLAFALVGGLLICYHAYLQDCTILLLVFVLVLEHSRWVPLRGATALALTPPLFLLLVAGKPWNAAVPLALLTLLVLAGIRPAAPAPARAGTGRPGIGIP
jgi:hypothetical protein